MKADITMPHPFEQVLEQDSRYTIEAYAFICEALAYARDVLGMGGTEDIPEISAQHRKERHITGRQLCEASRRLALERYGMMAKVVLNSWGVHTTGDLGELVYNLIRVEQMSKSAEDRREDFDDLFDFRKAFQEDFDFSVAQRPSRNLPRS